jgi:[ribosomal protein S5]-alanine N-acetyltransferase
MADYTPERIAGPRLLLRLPVLDDAGTLFQRVARDPQVTKYLLWTPHPDVAATRRVIAERINVGEHDRTWAIVLQHSDELVGMISCWRPVRHSAEIGYCIGRRWWGKGLMSEALDMLLAALDNERSTRLLQRAGFLLEGRLARHAVYPNLGPEPRDSLLFAKALR